MNVHKTTPEIHPTDVLIIGSGPAGMSTALHLASINPAWAGRMVVVDKAVHPREKLCGGGVTRPGEEILARLGLPFEPAHVSVRELRLVYRNLTYTVRDEPVFRVVRRAEFDHWLVRQGEARGIAVRQGEAVTNIIPGPNYVEVQTERATFRAQVVVATDGSRSVTRQKLNWPGAHRMARLLEVLTPEVAAERVEFRHGVAVFDFTPAADGVQGYYWDFPSRVNGAAMMNRGIFDSRVRPNRPRASLKRALRHSMARRGRRLDDYPLKGHPIHWFDRRGQFAIPRVILAGDAAGVDPFVGEGISFALGYGRVAAAAVAEAFARRDFSFAAYRRRILSDPLLAQLPVRTALARFIYGFNSPLLLAVAWRLAPAIAAFLVWYSPGVIPFSSPRLVKQANSPN
ncbi:MAG: FAD-dependent monooxygenase [Anaerolineae bacterium]